MGCSMNGPPVNSPLYRKIVELLGPIPDGNNSKEIPIALPIHRETANEIGYGPSVMFHLILAQWLTGCTVCEAFAAKGNFRSNRRSVKKLVNLGLIHYDRNLDLAIINEDAALRLIERCGASYPEPDEDDD